MSVILGLFGVAALVVATALLGATLRPRSVTEYVLVCYLVGSALVVVVGLGLSVINALALVPLVVVLFALLAGTGFIWRRSGSPRPPVLGVDQLRSALGDPVLLVLGVAVGLAAAYLTVVAVVIPPVDWDVLLYHLPRPLLWLDRGGVGFVDAAPDPRINGFPVFAEIQVATTVLLSGGTRLAAIPQAIAAIVTLISVAGIARRLGATATGAAFCALVFASYPVFALQVPTALNDIVGTAPLAAGTCLALNGLRLAYLASLGAGIGLAVGTKVSGILLAPIAFGFVLLAQTPRRPRPLVLAAVLGGALGSVWYAANLLHGQPWEGGTGSTFAQVPDRSPGEVLVRAQSLVLGFVELPGAVGADRYVFALVALAMAIAPATVAVVRRGGWLRQTLPLAAGFGGLAAAPFLLEPTETLVLRLFYKAWLIVGRPDLAAAITTDSHPVAADPMRSAFGFVFPLAVLTMLVVLAKRADGASRRAARLGALLSPAVFVVLLAAAVTVDELRMRFFMFPVALATATFAPLLKLRAVAWLVVGLSVTTLGLSLIHFEGRPAGVTLFEPTASESLWSASRPEAFAALGRKDSRDRFLDDPRVFELFDDEVPADATVAMALVPDIYLFPFFGPELSRHLVFVPQTGEVPDGSDWLAFAPGRPTALCRPGWTLRLRTANDWVVFARSPTSICGD